MGRFLSGAAEPPDLVLSSSALRARTTAELVVEAAGWSCPQRATDTLYLGSLGSVLGEITAQDAELARLLVVGHQPTCSELASRLIGGGQLAFPPAALARIDFEGARWSDVESDGAGLVWLLTPADLPESGDGAEIRDLSRLSGGAVEIERKYLLRGLPPIKPGADVAEVDQGWLPGERIHERIRWVRKPTGNTYFRTIKLGRGVARLELEEETSVDVFDCLWPLTAGRRIRKRRYQVREGDLLWEIDEFLDRDLCLAEVELDHAGDRPAFPDWLAPHVVREVTDDPRYPNRVLAELGSGIPSED